MKYLINKIGKYFIQKVKWAIHSHENFLGRNLHVIFWQLPCVFISISQIWHMKLHPCHRSFPINFVFTAFVFETK